MIKPKMDVCFEMHASLGYSLQVSHTEFVAVHCTHGINRTGYLICRCAIDSVCTNDFIFLLLHVPTKVPH